MTAQGYGYALWCRSLFASLGEGSVWAVPRSGLIFTRRGDRLVLTARMPWGTEFEQALADGADVPASAEALAAYQAEDLKTIREQFEAAGITVEDWLEAAE